MKVIMEEHHQLSDRKLRHLPKDDEYSDLQYDPNSSTNLKGDGQFKQRPHGSVVEFHQNPKCGDSGKRESLLIKGSYRYISDTSLALEASPLMAADENVHSYHLHPQIDQCSSLASLCSFAHAHKLATRGLKLSRPFCFDAEVQHESTLPHKSIERQESCIFSSENIDRSPELSEDMQAMQIQDCLPQYQQEQSASQGQKTETQQKDTFMITSPAVSLTKNRHPTEAALQRNKLTLRCNTSKCDSYVKAHGCKQTMLPHAEKVTLKGKKVQWKKHPNPSRQQQSPGLEVTAEHGDFLSLSSNSDTGPESPCQTSPSAITLNIHLKSPTNALIQLQQTRQDVPVNLASLRGQIFLQKASRLDSAKGSQLTNPDGFCVEYPNQKAKADSYYWQRTSSLPYEGQVKTWIPSEMHNEQPLQNLPTIMSSTSSQGSGTFRVLPPIGKTKRERISEQSCQRRENTSCPIQSSYGYLAQMEKQKKQRQACSQIEPKQLQSHLNRHGLHHAATTTAEKMKRQTLYSQVIPKQNKGIRRNPVTKDPEGKDKEVPRLKALEYAKTIVKPPLRSQAKPKEKQRPEGFTEHNPHMEDLDVSKQATLDLLLKRHEEEKQAVALFGKVHAV